MTPEERQARLDDCKESARVVRAFYAGLEARCLVSNIEWLVSEVERLEDNCGWDAFVMYGRHLDSCISDFSTPCTCGFAQIKPP